MIVYEAVITYVHEGLVVNVGKVGDTVLVEVRDSLSAYAENKCTYAEWPVYGRYDPKPIPEEDDFVFCFDILTGEEITV